jgi:hypothetical protein
MLESPAEDKHSSLLGPLVNREEKSIEKMSPYHLHIILLLK